MSAVWHYIGAPGTLLGDTIAAQANNGGARFGAWFVDLIVLSVLLPLLVGLAAVLFGYFKPDKDAAAAISRDKYPARHVALRAERIRAETAPQGGLELPSPEPHPFTPAD